MLNTQARIYTTYTHPLAPGLVLTVEGESRGYWEGWHYFEEELIVESAKLSLFDGEPLDLLEGFPRGRDAYCWLMEMHPDKARLVELAIEQGARKDVTPEAREAA